jgi:hypothetical protein
MITWTIEALEYDDTDPTYPKSVDLIHLKATHESGPIHYFAIQLQMPSEEQTYIPFESLTEEWAFDVWRSIDPSEGQSSVGYLNDLVSMQDRGQGKPWETTI